MTDALSDIHQLRSRILTIAGEVNSLDLKTLSLSDGDALKRQKEARLRSLMAMKLLEARSLFEAMAEIKTPGEEELFLKTSRIMLALYLKAGLPAEAMFIYGRHLKSPGPGTQLSAAALRRLQLELVLFLFDQARPAEAEEILKEMPPPDGTPDAAAIFSFLYFLYILYYAKISDRPKAELVYGSFLELLSAQFPAALDTTLTLVQAVPPRPGEEAAVKVSELVPKTVGPVSQLTVVTRPLKNPAELGENSEDRSLSHLDNLFRRIPDPDMAGSLLALSAEKLAELMILDRDFEALKKLNQTLDILPDCAAHREIRARMLLTVVEALVGILARPEAEEFFNALMALPPSPEITGLRARAIVSLLSLASTGSSLAKAKKLYAQLMSLGAETDFKDQKISGTGSMIMLYAAHGRFEESFKLCFKYENEPVEFRYRDCLIEAYTVCLQALARAGRIDEASEIYDLILKAEPSPAVQQIKSQAAMRLLAVPVTPEMRSLVLKVFRGLTGLRAAEPDFKPRFAAALKNLFAHLAEEALWPETEMYLNALDSMGLNRQDEFSVLWGDAGVKILGWYLEISEFDKFFDLVQRIDALAAVKNLTAVKAQLELVLLKHDLVLEKTAQALERLDTLKSLRQKDPATALYLARALAASASFEASGGRLEGVLLHLGELSELLKESCAPRTAPLAVLFGQTALLAMILCLKDNQLLLARDLLGRILGAPGCPDRPPAAYRPLTVMAAGLLALDLFDDALTVLNNLDSSAEDGAGQAEAEITLMIIKKLISGRKISQVDPYIQKLAARGADLRLLPYYAEALETVSRGYAEAGQFFAKFKLARPPRPRRQGPKSDATLTGQAPSTDNSYYWLETLLGLPSRKLSAVKISQRKAVFRLITALVRHEQLNKAMEILELMPRPAAGDSYEEIKLYLNSAFAVIEGLGRSRSPSPIVAEFMHKLVSSDLTGIMVKYYLADLAGFLKLAAGTPNEPAMSEIRAQLTGKFPELKALLPEPGRE
ncbi:MAG: hypothetical protein LBP22_13475 [Deltaproteobacteria bacterium]|jgi:pentatricopeptide repeat protein|nr:hypothetical protein [Deltaproteobacteria bacterium]